MGAWAPWDYILSYIGITGLALLFMHLTHRRAMDKMAQVYDQGLAEHKALISALQTLIVILEQIVAKERNR